MKKIVAMTALAAAAAGTLSAEITFGMWGRALWNTAANSGHDDIVTDVHQSWGGDAPRGGLSVHGTSDNVGVNIDFHANGTNGIALGDNNHIWVKPIDQFKLTVGKIDVNELRGDACFGLWDWDRIGCIDKNGSAGEGFIFPDIFDGTGVKAVFYPIEGLTIGAKADIALTNAGAEETTGATSTTTYTVETWKDSTGVDATTPAVGDVYTFKTNTTTKDGTTTKYPTSDTLAHVWGNKTNFAMGYAVENLGTFKLGVTTNNQVKKYKKDGTLKHRENYAVINAAAELTPVENILFSVGAQIPTVKSGKYAFQTLTKKVGHGYSESFSGEGYISPVVNAYFRFKASDALTIHVINGNRLDTYNTYKKDKALSKYEKGHYGWLLGAGVDYNMENGIGFFGDVRYANDIYMSNNSNAFGCLTTGIGVNKSFSNGSIGVALETASNNFGRYNLTHSHVKGYADANSRTAWSVPVRVQYWF